MFFHGGIANLQPGDTLKPSPPHITDGCPICVARAEGRTVTVGEYRAWLKPHGARALPVLKALEGSEDWEPIDPPTKEQAVYLTSDRAYARWYAARSRGDLYRVEPIGELRRSTEDPFPSWLAPEARVVEVLERRVRLDRKFRREIQRRWAKADAAKAQAGQGPKE